MVGALGRVRKRDRGLCLCIVLPIDGVYCNKWTYEHRQNMTITMAICPMAAAAMATTALYSTIYICVFFVVSFSIMGHCIAVDTHFGLFVAKFIGIYAISCFSLSLALRLANSVFTDFIVCLAPFRSLCPAPLSILSNKCQSASGDFWPVFFFLVSKINYCKHVVDRRESDLIANSATWLRRCSPLKRINHNLVLINMFDQLLCRFNRW